ncbi:HNH endonuclease signature motif containing protein [Aeromonas enteropelogenes]|uniref:HNH endonuclease signature motif containing protein n=1 Tax=Aeromonas enteropelogenes TaxID=29489 RepID=UPI003BA137A0
MTRARYTPEQLSFIAETFKECSLAETTSMFNFVFGTDKTAAQIKACVKNHGFTCGRKAGEINKGKLRAFSDTQKTWIEQQFKELPLGELVQRFNAEFGTDKTEGQIRAFTKNHQIKSGRTGQFSKGNKPWNTGFKGWEAGGNSASTRFKAGHTPLNHRPVGSERVNVDGYVEVKVAEPRSWCLKHRVVWERHHGPIPPDRVIWFIDNNPLNCDDVTNLMLVTRAQHAVVSKLGLHQATGELKQTTALIADVAMARVAASKKARECRSSDASGIKRGSR